MKKSKKILLGLVSASTFALPLVAISCTDYKTELEKEVQIAKQQLSNVEFADDFETQFKAEIIKAENVLKKENVEADEYQKALNEFVAKAKEILKNNKEKIEEYVKNQGQVFLVLNSLKQYAHEQLKGDKYKTLKAKLVEKYQEKETELISKKSSFFNPAETKKFKDALNQILEEIKAEKEQLDNPSSSSSSTESTESNESTSEGSNEGSDSSSKPSSSEETTTTE